MNIKYLILRIGMACLRLLYMPIKLRRNENKITFISRQSNEETIDIALLSDFIKKNHKDMKVQVLVRFLKPGVLNLISYAFHMIEQMNAIATSRAVVLDGYCIVASILNHRNDTKIIQMWHSMAAIKKFGKQNLDREAGNSSTIADIMRMHRNYDYVVCPSKKTGDFFCEAFGCSNDRLVLFCLPRTDYIKEKCRFHKKDYGKEMILYAPTFRKSDSLNVKSLFEAIDYDRFTLVVKPHPLFQQDFTDMIKEMKLEGKVMVDNEKSTYDWMGACDRVISDYSAIAIETLVTEKPVYFYVYDIDDYEKKTGLNINPFRDIPSLSARTGEELRILLERDYDWKTYYKFRDEYLTADTDNCTEKLGEFIIGVANGNN